MEKKNKTVYKENKKAKLLTIGIQCISKSLQWSGLSEEKLLATWFKGRLNSKYSFQVRNSEWTREGCRLISPAALYLHLKGWSVRDILLFIPEKFCIIQKGKVPLADLLNPSSSSASLSLLVSFSLSFSIESYHM